MAGDVAFMTSQPQPGDTMSPTTLPARITIDFRESLDPGRGWILGLAESPKRIELLAFEKPEAKDPSTSAAVDAGCTCPDFCERDHDMD
jgi:hypothetical protein